MLRNQADSERRDASQHNPWPDESSYIGKERLYPAQVPKQMRPCCFVTQFTLPGFATLWLEAGETAKFMTTGPQSVLGEYYEALFAAYGPQHWWPGRTSFEIIVGAILVQNTAWTNVERAIANLRRERLLSPRAIETVSSARLARLIRSSGYFRQKAKKLKAFVRFLRSEYGGSLTKMFATPTAPLREQLLAVHGIGPETADSILLYAGNHPVFVVDAYTRRMLERHGLAQPKDSYQQLRRQFESSLAADAPLYNEFHALIVHTGKHYCRNRDPLCARCPLQSFLPPDGAAAL
jgi:endonuclease III related protein